MCVSVPLLRRLHLLHALLVKLPEPHANARRVFQELLAALAHASLLILLQRLPAKALNAGAETFLHKVIVHAEAVSRLHAFNHGSHLLLFLRRRREAAHRVHLGTTLGLPDLRSRRLLGRKKPLSVFARVHGVIETIPPRVERYTVPPTRAPCVEQCSIASRKHRSSCQVTPCRKSRASPVARSPVAPSAASQFMTKVS